MSKKKKKVICSIIFTDIFFIFENALHKNVAISLFVLLLFSLLILQIIKTMKNIGK